MPSNDNYEIYYADKLWNLLPAIYRTLDTDVYNSNGPLRELVNRIGAQAAILRRSIDRLWEDQSIESCDDWVISYIGDLLQTNLVASLDARGQRLDVAKTIYYRRRKGTVAVLEEIATDITGWDARVVEFFRRLGRTRHNLDPQITRPDAATEDNHTLQLAEGLTGTWTDTKIGGWADLRNAYGAYQAQSPFSVSKTVRPASAFDEYFHTADFRAGHGKSGWYNIPKLGVFLWRLQSFGVSQSTPVSNGSCYTFDPTGRQIPLFAVSSRPLGDTWVSPQEWQLPGPISTPLLQAGLANPTAEPLYAALSPDGTTLLENSMGFFTKPGSFYELVDASQVTAWPEASGGTHKLMVFPETGQFAVLRPPLDGPVTVSCHYGFSAPIGAGPYDRRIVGGTPTPTPAPMIPVMGGSAALTTLPPVPSVSTISLNDSLTYDGAPDIAGIQNLTILSQNQNRPLVRFMPSSEWVLTASDGGVLVLDGLFVSGCDIVLRGDFSSVTITCCTFDPGSAAQPPAIYQQSMDGRELVPTRIWVEGEIQQINIDRSILGPIRTRNGGDIESLTVTNSILQSIPTTDYGVLGSGDVKDLKLLAVRLRDGVDALSEYLQSSLPAGTQSLLTSYSGDGAPSMALTAALLDDLNALIGAASLYDAGRFDGISLSPVTKNLLAEFHNGDNPTVLNRHLLEDAYPLIFADLCLGQSSGAVSLSRCTLLGASYVHRVEVSECILDDTMTVENYQQGCIRFSAWSTGSVIPRQYESVQIPPDAALFTSRVFGRPGYAQLLDSADNTILSPTTGSTILAGAQDGSEMGAFAMQKNPIKERSILIKYQEYMPLGLTPILIHVT